jgi:hypothetical protein
VELRPQRPLLFPRQAGAKLMYGHHLPLRALRLSGVKFSQSRNSAIAFQYAEVGGNQWRLKDAVVARDGVQQSLEFRQLFQHGSDLFFIGPGRQFMRKVGAM